MVVSTVLVHLLALVLTLCICGWPCRWRTATQLSGANADDEVVEVFWDAIGELTEDERGMVRHVVIVIITNC